MQILTSNERLLTVAFPAQSGQTPYKLFAELPDSIKHYGKIYYKHGARVSTSMAWYRTRWLP
jgi:hypothetical protein